ncbi:MAG: transposase [Bacteroidales bacterium]|nr:transposase [Bacteroidales bacterium]
MMKEIFKNIDTETFDRMFSDDDKCLEYLANQKWKKGYVCKKCGNKNFCRGKTLFSRRCTRCKYDESATAHTLFHRCKMPISKAFRIIFLVCNKNEISINDISRQIDIRIMTCWKFKQKIIDCLQENKSIIS